jgi:DNA recombination protein RmuC
MQIELIVIAVLFVVLCIVFYKIITTQKDENNQLKEYVNLSKEQIQKNEIQIATLEQKLISHLKIQEELQLIKEENQTLKIDLSQQNEYKQNTQARVQELKDDLDIQKDTNFNLNNELSDAKVKISQIKTQLEEQQTNLQDRIKDMQENEEKLKIQFKNLASEILDNNSKKFKEQNSESLGLILNPMKQQLESFKKKVEDVYDKDVKDRSELSAELKLLKELNQKMSQEAHNLTSALKGQNKTQGAWGEMVLEKVLESSGLREGYEYKREVSLKDEENKTFRPDVIVNLPENRHIIIDAKTSLLAYNEYISSDDEVQKELYIKNHIRSIKEHIKSLASKKYEDLQNINSLDFIFMFVPIEGALLLALENDVNLYDEAFKQKIILVSPTTLLVALRAVENTWRYEKQAQSITEVYSRATKLYEKIEGFVSTLENVGKSIKKANVDYDKAYSQLYTGSGNVIRQVTMLKDVSNIKPKTELKEELVNSALQENSSII